MVFLYAAKIANTCPKCRELVPQGKPCFWSPEHRKIWHPRCAGLRDTAKLTYNTRENAFVLSLTRNGQFLIKMLHEWIESPTALTVQNQGRIILIQATEKLASIALELISDYGVECEPEDRMHVMRLASGSLDDEIAEAQRMANINASYVDKVPLIAHTRTGDPLMDSIMEHSENYINSWRERIAEFRYPKRKRSADAERHDEFASKPQVTHELVNDGYNYEEIPF